MMRRATSSALSAALAAASRRPGRWSATSAGNYDNDSAPVGTIDRLVFETNKIQDWELKDYVEPEKQYTQDGAVIINNVAYSLEWVLSSPPPLHAFIESPTMVEWPKEE
eukprot:CAMPEP_0181289122 /NCGR_PEP_ID=MMETSP1101-20121128/713_1 /TAXON_ID=46948 /ORGANISM="Rhodomonas abbreviata, Strain Caron Lab Isolate" /LENGTH=108 /DNA_ID=CAMNT_0023393321 /DNA_START=31 /DNA_END=356 /DNA_ORIENTATION=-